MRRENLWGREVILHPSGVLQCGSAAYAADLHLGKSRAFRRLGVPVPEGETTETLSTLTRALEDLDPSRLVLLGDVWHASSSLEPGLEEALGKALSPWPVTLIRGNHDRGGAAMVARLGWNEAPEGHREDGWTLLHHPGDQQGEPWLAGHLHPQVRLGQGRTTERARCFWLTQGGLVLPSLGSFTGGSIISPQPGDRVWAVAGQAVVEAKPQAWAC
jgi:DNA ligase-associated metallophosphoesterase